MKRFLIGLSVTFLLISCQKQDQEELARIPGMGDTPGELQIEKPFTLPSDVKILGDITGIDDSGAKSGESKSFYLYGSGGRMIKLKITLLNTSNSWKTVFFLKGLVWKSLVPGYQSAICLQTTWVSLMPNSQRTFYIDLYCINQGLNPSDGNSLFQILGITSSPIIQDLLKLISWRMINYEWIYGYINNKSLMTGPSYDEITERLQQVVWNLTNNGIPVSSDDKAFIESIPLLPESQRPAVDSNSQFPEYFKDFFLSME